MIHNFLYISDTHVDVEGYKRCCRRTEINEFEVTENINSCQTTASDTCLASGRTEVESVIKETVDIVTENSNLFLQMALESQGSRAEYVLHE